MHGRKRIPNLHAARMAFHVWGAAIGESHDFYNFTLTHYQFVKTGNHIVLRIRVLNEIRLVRFSRFLVQEVQVGRGRVAARKKKSNDQ